MNESDPSLVATAVSSATTKKNEDVENETGQTGTVSQTDECIGSHQQSVALGHDNQVVSTVHHSTETAEHTFLFRVDVDIVQEILLFLRFTELARLRRVCRSFQWVCQSNVVWDRRYMVIQTANRVTGPGNHTPFEHSLWTIYQEQMNLALSMGLLRSSGPYGRYFSAIAAMFTSNVFTHFLCCCTDTLSKIKLGIRELEKSLRNLIRKAEQEVRALRETESKLTDQRSILSRQGQRMKQCLGLLQREPDCTSLMREVEGATPETLDALCASFSSSLEHEGMEPIRIIPDRNAVPLSPEAERAAQLVANSDTDARAAATVQELESYRTRIANLSALNKMFSIYAANLEEQNRLEQCIVNIKIQLHATIEYQTRLDHMLQHQLGYLLHVQLKEQAIRNTYQWQLHVMAIIDTRT